VSINLNRMWNAALNTGSYVLNGVSINLLRPIRNMFVNVGQFILTGYNQVTKGRGYWNWGKQNKNTSSWIKNNKSSSIWTDQDKS